MVVVLLDELSDVAAVAVVMWMIWMMRSSEMCVDADMSEIEGWV